VAWAAFWNFVAAFAFGTAVAKTMGRGLVRLESVNERVILAGLLGAIFWNLLTLWLGLPTSSSHALMGGYGGAAVAKAGLGAIIVSGWVKPVVFVFLAPFLGLLTSAVVTVAASWTVRRESPQRVDRWFRRLQLLSAAAYSLGHGTNDAQKGMGIITAALVASGISQGYDVPFWVIIACHLAIGGGTMAGGWRIVKTMGQRITKLSPFGGFAADVRSADSGGHSPLRDSREHHAHHHRRHYGCRGGAAADRRTLGRYSAHRLGVGADDPRRWGAGHGDPPPPDSLKDLRWPSSPARLLASKKPWKKFARAASLSWWMTKTGKTKAT
jgi:PiT family inorganic phosphate transporter